MYLVKMKHMCIATDIYIQPVFQLAEVTAWHNGVPVPAPMPRGFLVPSKKWLVKQDMETLDF